MHRSTRPIIQRERGKGQRKEQIAFELNRLRNYDEHTEKTPSPFSPFSTIRIPILPSYLNHKNKIYLSKPRNAMPLSLMRPQLLRAAVPVPAVVVTPRVEAVVLDA